MSVRDQLVEMGFTPSKIEAALKNTSGSLEESIGWLEEHQASYEEAQRRTGTSNEGGFVDLTQSEGNDLDSHDTHDANETTTTPTPLSEDDKAQKLAVLKEKARLRKIEEAKKDAEEKRKNEAILKKQTRETRQIAEEQQQKNAVKEAERRRQQAREDALAKKRIKDQIEADRRARKAEQDALKASKGPQQSVSPVAAPAATSLTSSASKNVTESKIRFRVQGSSSVAPFMEVFPVDSTLGEVAEKVGTILSAPGYSLVFMTTFPTKTFTQPDFGSTLRDLGLVNTNLIVKPTPII